MRSLLKIWTLYAELMVFHLTTTWPTCFGKHILILFYGKAVWIVNLMRQRRPLKQTPRTEFKCFHVCTFCSVHCIDLHGYSIFKRRSCLVLCTEVALGSDVLNTQKYQLCISTEHHNCCSELGFSVQLILSTNRKVAAQWIWMWENYYLYSIECA